MQQMIQVPVTTLKCLMDRHVLLFAYYVVWQYECSDAASVLFFPAFPPRLFKMKDQMLDIYLFIYFCFFGEVEKYYEMQ